MTQRIIFILAAGGLLLLLAALTSCNRYSLDRIKSKTVGDGQHGTARWATSQEIRKTFAHVPFRAKAWAVRTSAGR